VEVDFDFSDSLYGVEVQGNPVGFTEIREGEWILDDSGFVVGEEERRQADLSPGELLKVFVQKPAGIDGEFLAGVSAKLKSLDRFCDGGVLSRAGEDGAGSGEDQAIEGQVIRFRSAAGEEEFVGIGSEDRRDGFAGIFENSTGFSTE